MLPWPPGGGPQGQDGNKYDLKHYWQIAYRRMSIERLECPLRKPSLAANRPNQAFTPDPGVPITVSMTRLTPAWIVVLTSLAVARAEPAPPAGLPDLSIVHGQALLRWARAGMKRYLTHRAGAEAMPIPGDLRPLSGRDNAAAVTLRSRGAVVAVQVQAGSSLHRNVLAAALLAMRSPKLPDRVDSKVLDALTIEVEVLSRPHPVAREELAAASTPGLTGLAYWRGPPVLAAPGRPPPRPTWQQAGDVAWILPSAGYVLTLAPEQMRRAAMVRYRLTPQNASLPSHWAVFTTRHYVGLPDGQRIELFRGMDLSRRRSVDERAFRDAAERVGAYLARGQDKLGRYQEADGPASVCDHLYATYAMSRLAARGGKAIARSAARAAGCASVWVRRNGDHAGVGDDNGKVSLAATALLALALGQAAPDEPTRRLRTALLRGLLAQWTPGPASSPATRPARSGPGPYLALLALKQEAKHARDADRLREALAGLAPSGPTARLWACRAGLGPSILPTPTSSAPARERLRPVTSDALPDELGGFAEPGKAPLALHTGLAAVCLAQAPRTERLGKALFAARRFCYSLLYRPGETYFHRDGDALVGAVRRASGSAAVSVSACAATIEALLAAPSPRRASAASPLPCEVVGAYCPLRDEAQGANEESPGI